MTNHPQDTAASVDEETLNNIYMDLVGTFHEAADAPAGSGEARALSGRYEGEARMFAKFTGQDFHDVLKCVKQDAEWM